MVGWFCGEVVDLLLDLPWGVFLELLPGLLLVLLWWLILGVLLGLLGNSSFPKLFDLLLEVLSKLLLLCLLSGRLLDLLVELPCLSLSFEEEEDTEIGNG